jgi:hypothetical protein
MKPYAIVNLFEFSLGITIVLEDEAYNIKNGNAESIIQMIHEYDVPWIMLVGPSVITEKYKRDIEKIDMTHYGNRKYDIVCVEG